MITKKFLDQNGLRYLLSKLDDYPTNELLGTVINAIDTVKADRSEVPTIVFGTSQDFNSQTNLIGANNAIYIYTDYQQDSEGNDIAGIKIGDGNAFLIDKPFIDTIMMEHINDTVRHITAQERLNWNNKVSARWANNTLFLENEDVINNG